MSLTEKLTQPPTREQVIKDCCTLIDEEVRGKGGMSGIAVKGAYKLVKTVKPGFVPDVVDALLDDWVGKLDPFYQDWRENGGGKPFDAYLASRPNEVAERLLEVTDSRSQNAKNASVKKIGIAITGTIAAGIRTMAINPRRARVAATGNTAPPSNPSPWPGPVAEMPGPAAVMPFPRAAGGTGRWRT